VAVLAVWWFRTSRRRRTRRRADEAAEREVDRGTPDASEPLGVGPSNGASTAP
jgi:hypothetical protein